MNSMQSLGDGLYGPYEASWTRYRSFCAWRLARVLHLRQLAN